MKNIWIIDHYSSEPEHGGYSRQYNFAKGLSEAGYNVTVFASSFSHFRHSYITDKKSMISEMNNKARYVYIRTANYSGNDGLKRLLGMLQFAYYIKIHHKKYENNFGKPDYVVGSSPHPFVLEAARTIAKKSTARFIAEFRDFWPLELRSNHDDLFHKILYAYFERIEIRAFNGADRIISTLPYGDKYVCDEKQISRDKYIWIGQPIDCHNFDLLAEKNKNNLPKEICEFIEGKYVCVFAGYYMKYTGVFKMLEAAKVTKEDYKDIVYLFCGSGGAEASMREYVNHNSLDNVLIYGRIEKNLIPTLLRKSNICLANVSDDTGNGVSKYGLSLNKLNEYLYSGRPIILGYGYGNEVVESNAGFTFDTDADINRFPELVKRIYNMDMADQRELGLNGMKFSYEKHDIRVLTKKYINNILQS